MLRQLSRCSLSTSGVHVGGKPAHLTLPLTVCLTGPFEVPNMFPTLWIVIFLCLRTSSSAQSTFSPVMLVIPAENLTSSTEIAPLWVWKNHWFRKTTDSLTSESFSRVLSQFPAQCDADLLSGYAKFVNGTIHSDIQQDINSTITCATALLQAGNDSRLSLFVVVEIFSGSNSVLFTV